jgi:hypothetical protein
MKQLLTTIVFTTILVLIMANDRLLIDVSAQTDNKGILENLLNNSTTTSAPPQQGPLKTIQTENKSTIRVSPSLNDTVGAGFGANTIVPNQTPENITATINSLMSPKALLSSAIDQIRNSTSKSLKSSDQTTSGTTVIILNTGVMQLANQNIPAKDFILVYFGDSTVINSGNIDAKLPCSNKSQSVLQILVNNKSYPLLPINALSRPGSTCMYSVDLSNNQNSTASSMGSVNNTNTQAQPNSTSQYSKNLNSTAIQLFNPTSHPVVLPSTSSIAISLQLIYHKELGKGH